MAFVISAEAQAQELTLEETQRLAETAQPQLNARRSAIEAASEAAEAARELPDPRLKLGIVNVPIEGDRAFSFDAEPMTMATIGVIQAFTLQSKRMLRGEVYSLAGERSASELAELRLQLRRDAALSWLEVWLAERALELIARQQREVQIEIESLVIALRNNRASAADVSAARVELELLRDREQAQLGMKHGARARLSRWVGERAAAPLPVALPEKPQPGNTDLLASIVAAHPRLEAAQTQARITETEAQLANLSTRPDWSMELTYGHRASQYGGMISLQFQFDMPILQDRRQNRSIAARLAEAQQARELREDELREMHSAALQLRAQWQSADARVRLFEEHVLPQARNSLRAAIASYRSGKGQLREVLAARRALLDLELAALMRRAEVMQLAIELEYFGATGESS